MSSTTADDILAAQMEDTAKPPFDFSDKIRNVSIIGSIFHGKTCLKNALAASKPFNHVNYAQSSQLNNNPSYSTNYSSLTVNYKTHPYFISVADTPGHIECLDEVFSALRITDGAIIVVDCIEGPRLQMDVVIKSLLEEQVRPVLFINMIDRAIIEQNLSEEDLYNRFDQTIKKLNSLVTKTDPNAPESFIFDPFKGNVIFGSAKNGWTFNLDQFAKLCAKKINISESKVLPRMWGDNFYDEAKKQFISHNTSSNGSSLRRFFCKVVLEPIFKILNTVNDNHQDLNSLMKKLDITLENNNNKLKGIELAHCILRKRLSGTDALIGSVIEQLPSPNTAQKYIATLLYKHDDTIFQSISQCDANGPAVVYVSRNLLSADKSSFHTIARVFSGTITAKDKLFVVGIDLGKEWNGSEYAPKSKVRTIKKLTTLSGSTIDYCPCGNIVIIEGIDLVDERNNFTLSSIEAAMAINSPTITPIPRLGLVFTINTDNMTPYLPALRKVYHCDVRNHVVTEHVVWPAVFECHGEFHANTIIDRLKEFIGNSGMEYKTDYHIMLYESVTEMSSKMSVAVTPNKHNRFWIKMEPLNDNTMKIINTLNTNKKITNVTEFAKKIGLDEQTANNTWYIGPAMIESEWSSNIFTNYTKNVLSIDEERIQKLMKTGFTNAVQEGALCGEQMTGTKTNLHEANVYSRNGYLPIINAVQRAMKAAQLRAKPILLEPIMKLELSIDHVNIEKVKEILIKRRAFNIDEEKLSRIHSIVIGFLPLVESTGLMKELYEGCKQLLYPQMLFDHWKVIEGDPLTEGSLANKIMMQVRQRKGMTMEIPKPEDFEDKGYNYYE